MQRWRENRYFNMSEKWSPPRLVLTRDPGLQSWFPLVLLLSWALYVHTWSGSVWWKLFIVCGCFILGLDFLEPRQTCLLTQGKVTLDRGAPYLKYFPFLDCRRIDVISDPIVGVGVRLHKFIAILFTFNLHLSSEF